MFPEGDIADPQMSNEATDWLAPSFYFFIFWAQLERMLACFRQRAKKDPGRGSTALDLHRAAEAWCSRGIAGPNFNTPLDPSLECSREKVVLFWQPPSYFPPWPPSLFVADDVLYSCAEQYVMSEKTRLSQDH